MLKQCVFSNKINWQMVKLYNFRCLYKLTTVRKTVEMELSKFFKK